jgi:hypothetical protein
MGKINNFKTYIKEKKKYILLKKYKYTKLNNSTISYCILVLKSSDFQICLPIIRILIVIIVEFIKYILRI